MFKKERDILQKIAEKLFIDRRILKAIAYGSRVRGDYSGDAERLLDDAKFLNFLIFLLKKIYTIITIIKMSNYHAIFKTVEFKRKFYESEVKKAIFVKFSDGGMSENFTVGPRQLDSKTYL